MTNDWREFSINDCAHILDAQRKPINSAERQRRPGTVPYYGAAGQAGWIDSALFNEPLVLLGEDAVDFSNPLVDKAYRIDGPAWVNNHAHVLRAREDLILTDFLCYSLNQVDYSDFASFGTRSKLTQGKMIEIKIRIPSLPIQRRIVDLMTHLDSHLLNLRRERLSAHSLALQITSAHVNQCSSDNAIQRLPLSCFWSEESQVVKVDPNTDYSIAGVMNQGKGLIDKGVIRGTATQYARLTRLSTGQVVMRRLTGWEGPIAVVPKQFDGYFVSNEFPTFSIDETRMDSGYADLLCRWPGLWHEMRQRVTGSVMRRKRLSPEQLLSVAVPVPSIEQQRLVAKAVSAARESAWALDREIETLDAVRTNILSLLITGRSLIGDSYDALLSKVA